MEKSEWVFLIKNKEDLKHVIDVVSLHNIWENVNNEDCKDLHFICIFKYRSKMYCRIGNGCDDYNTSSYKTSKFISIHFNSKRQIYEPFLTSQDKQKIIWQSNDDSNTPNPDIIFST